jgi:formylglycine-generating enzyme required for sulfatase activity/serine/threonine protein kinase
MENEESQPQNATTAAQKSEQIKSRVLKSGESFGNYRVVKCLCAGLIAHYYHMQHIRDLHDVTVAVFHYRTAEDADFFERLLALQKNLGRLEHESIPTVRDVTKVNKRICMFLDPVKGRTLSQYFSAQAKPGQSGIGEKTTIRIIAQLHGLLGYAHTQGLDHRDLDTDLIYVDDDGTLYLLGLGVKAAVGIELFESIVSASVSPLVSTKTLGRLNSFDIMSPEYRAGIAEDARVDIYGLGFIGYWLLTGRKAELAHYQAPSKWVESLSPNWDLFCEKSLERVKDQRFQSCKLALIALKEVDKTPQSEGGHVVQQQIDRIPVPQRIVDRGELATRIYRLFLIGLVGLTLTALASYFLSVAYTLERDDTPAIAKSMPTAANASVQIQVDPLIAKVAFLEHDESFISNNGQLNLKVKPGTYRLSVSAPRYVEEVVRLEVPSDSETPQRLSFELSPARADLRVRTLPGAFVSVIDDRGFETKLGQADAEGLLTLDDALYAGSYQVLVNKPGYQNLTLEAQSFDLDQVAEIDAPLKPMPAELTIRTEPSGAAIWIDTNNLGATPLTLNELIPFEDYTFVARLDGYRPSARALSLKPGMGQILNFGELTPRSGQLDLKITVGGQEPPPLATLMGELQVVIDGKATPYKDASLDAVPAGRRVISLEHPLYTAGDVPLEVEDKGQHTVELTLNPRPGEVQLVLPDGLDAQLSVNGRAVALSDGGRVRVPAYTPIELQLRLRDYLTMARSVQLSPNEQFVWEVSPVPIPGPGEGQNWAVPYLNMPFVWIPSGTYQMGSPLPEHARLPNEGPQTSVRFSAGFWAGTYEVTQAEYAEIMGLNPAQFVNARRPVESVLWSEAKAFCLRLTQIEREAGRLPQGYVYRLPTEPEWEYAARGGTDTAFYFGDEADASLGHFRGVYPRDRTDGQRTPTGGYGSSVVGKYAPNPFGLYDVHGNLREWTLDAYNGRLEGEPLVDPKARREGDRIAVRGGGWEDLAPRVRSAAREAANPDVRSNAIGFRVVLAPEQ